MAETPRHHKPLDKRFNLGLTAEAYANLRVLAAETGLGNNYVLTVLLEDMDHSIDRAAFRRAAEEMLRRHKREPK